MALQAKVDDLERIIEVLLGQLSMHALSERDPEVSVSTLESSRSSAGLKRLFRWDKHRVMLIRDGDGYQPTQYWRGATDDALLTIQCAVRCWFAFVEVGLRRSVRKEHDHILQDRWLKANCAECGLQSGWCSDCDRARKWMA